MAQPADPRRIEVSPGALVAFAGHVRATVAPAVASHSGHLATTFDTDVRLGADNPSVDLGDLTSRYQVCVAAMGDQLDAYRRAIETVYQAAQQIALAYRASDAAAAVTTDTVNTALSRATVDAWASLTGRTRDEFAA